MMNTLKSIFAVFIVVLVAAAAIDYFCLEPPREGATFYGFLRYTGPMVAAIVAIIIAIAGNQAAYQRQTDALDRNSDEQKQRHEEMQSHTITGIAFELERLASSAYKAIGAFQIDKIDKTQRRVFHQEWDRHYFESVKARISELPSYAVVAIVRHEPLLHSYIEILHVSQEAEPYDLARHQQSFKMIASCCTAYSGALLYPDLSSDDSFEKVRAALNFADLEKLVMFEGDRPEIVALKKE